VLPGRSVTVVGHSDTVSESAGMDCLSVLPLQTLGSGRQQHYVRIKMEVISGWRLRSDPITSTRHDSGSAGSVENASAANKAMR
jgi:hypothetical protein